MDLPLPPLGNNLPPLPPRNGSPEQLNPENTSPPVDAEPTTPEDVIIQTGGNAKDGLNKCPKCGGTEAKTLDGGELICLNCRYRWGGVSFNANNEINSPIENLVGRHIASAASQDSTQKDTSVTIKCQGCGAEIVIETSESTSNTKRCPWCRQNISINSQMSNGLVPDALLPFKLSKEEAVAKIAEFAGKRKFFAHPKFKSEFKPDNVLGIYIPYMVIDGNVSGEVRGEGEIETRRYQVGSGDNKKTVYDADVYEVARKFDFYVDDLQIEASAKRSDMKSNRTNNIINTILPFDTENVVNYDSKYLLDFAAERRDLNVDNIEGRSKDQFLSIARSKATDSAPQYNRGIKWEHESVEVHGTRWVSTYLPVWLYSYYQKDKDIMHYIAVNARTGETMGSIPINTSRLLLMSVIIGIVSEIPGVALLVSHVAVR